MWIREVYFNSGGEEYVVRVDGGSRIILWYRNPSGYVEPGVGIDSRIGRIEGELRKGKEIYVLDSAGFPISEIVNERGERKKVELKGIITEINEFEAS
jgi:hypothetical protein